MAISFQHRHFKVIAAAFNDARLMVGADPDTIAATVTLFANTLGDTNPRFDRARFISACMGEPCNGRDKVRVVA